MAASLSPLDASLASRGAAALPVLLEAARLGGAIALADFREGAHTSARVEHKHGGSPVTAADFAVDQFLTLRLRQAFPEAGWLSEETADGLERLSRRELIVVDPIDGTRAFVGGDPRWTVSIALVMDHRVIAGVVHAPALKETYAAALGHGATLNGAPILASHRDGLEGARVAGPKPLVTSIASILRAEFQIEPKIPSLAYRLARVASGALDLAFASVDSHDWDVAGADVILHEAGAGLADAHGALSYNRERIRREVLVAAPLFWLPSVAAALPKRSA